MTRTWSDLIDEVAACLGRTRPHQFVLVQYDTGVEYGPEPYAQAAPDDDSWHCEVVSGHYLLPGLWPLDEIWLKRAGWTLRAGGAANWFQSAGSLQGAAELMIDGLRFGRYCTGPGRFLASVESFVGGPGPGGGGGRPLDIPAFAPSSVVVAA